MGWGRFFDFTDASLRGDLKWAQASKFWTHWAGPLVLTILVLAIVQIVLGVILLVGKDNTLTLYARCQASVMNILTLRSGTVI